MKSIYDDPFYAYAKEQLTQQLLDMRINYKYSTELDQKYIDMYNKNSLYLFSN